MFKDSAAKHCGGRGLPEADADARGVGREAEHVEAVPGVTDGEATGLDRRVERPERVGSAVWIVFRGIAEEVGA
jgi:hypothetical protein